VFKNKPRAIEHATYLKALPKIIKKYLLIPDLSERKARIKFLIKLLDDYTITEIKDSISTGLKKMKTDFDTLKSILEYQSTKTEKKEAMDESWTPESVANWNPSLKEYNVLCQEVLS
jgi:hypothetical protein